ncbi:hypothetical protein [Azospirillum sp. TSO35-2]|uniref:hypothetical protein n=1 Tax=Azospirillum sp. TSO35-2 TaxID=716796 RepID=UPI000D60B986|nr:hypothetical protein [Azospirillum sp. TSO35-2]PWC34438.1 hypothetical protein TSO352_17710 [Azospirillum sp. TSO35-2]
MNSTTFHPGSNDHTSSDALHAVAEFPVAWFEATPAYLVLRPVAAFLREWAAATPAGVVLGLLKR